MSLSRQEYDFCALSTTSVHFGAIHVTQLARQSVFFRNTGDRPMHFAWYGASATDSSPSAAQPLSDALGDDNTPHDLFSVSPARGVVYPRGRIEFTFFYAPVTAGTDSSTLYLDLDRAIARIPLSLHGLAVGPEVELDCDVLDVGSIVFGQTPVWPVCLTNRGGVAAAISFSPPATLFGATISAEPAVFRLAPSAAETVSLSFRADTLGRFKETVAWSVAGGGYVNLQVKGTVTAPAFSISKQAIDFGDVSFGFPTDSSVEITNLSPVDVSFDLGLDDTDTTTSTTTTTTACTDFMVLPTSMTLPPGGKGTAIVSYHPQTTVGQAACTLQIGITGVARKIRTVSVSGTAVCPTVVLAPGIQDMGQTELERTATTTITLTNTSDTLLCRYEAYVHSSAVANIAVAEVADGRGVLRPGQTHVLPVTIRPLVLDAMQVPIRVKVLGGAILESTISLTSVGPSLAISDHKLDLGTAPLLEEMASDFTLTNTSEVFCRYAVSVRGQDSPFRIVPPERATGLAGPGQTVQLTVVCAVNVARRHTDIIDIVATDSAPSPLSLHRSEISVTAMGVGSAVIVHPHDEGDLPALPRAALARGARAEEPAASRTVDLGRELTVSALLRTFTVENRSPASQTLTWASLPPSKAVVAAAETAGTPLAYPAIAIAPASAVVEPGAYQTFVLGASLSRPCVFEEEWVCRSTQAGRAGAVNLFTPIFKGEFVAPSIVIDTGSATGPLTVTYTHDLPAPSPTTLASAALPSLLTDASDMAAGQWEGAPYAPGRIVRISNQSAVPLRLQLRPPEYLAVAQVDLAPAGSEYPLSSMPAEALAAAHGPFAVSIAPHETVALAVGFSILNTLLFAPCEGDASSVLADRAASLAPQRHRVRIQVVPATAAAQTTAAAIFTAHVASAADALRSRGRVPESWTPGVARPPVGGQLSPYLPPSVVPGYTTNLAVETRMELPVMTLDANQLTLDATPGAVITATVNLTNKSELPAHFAFVRHDAGAWTLTADPQFGTMAPGATLPVVIHVDGVDAGEGELGVCIAHGPHLRLPVTVRCIAPVISAPDTLNLTNGRGVLTITNSGAGPANVTLRRREDDIAAATVAAAEQAIAAAEQAIAGLPSTGSARHTLALSEMAGVVEAGGSWTVKMYASGEYIGAVDILVDGIVVQTCQITAPPTPAPTLDVSITESTSYAISHPLLGGLPQPAWEGRTRELVAAQSARSARPTLTVPALRALVSAEAGDAGMAQLLAASSAVGGPITRLVVVDVGEVVEGSPITVPVSVSASSLCSVFSTPGVVVASQPAAKALKCTLQLQLAAETDRELFEGIVLASEDLLAVVVIRGFVCVPSLLVPQVSLGAIAGGQQVSSEITLVNPSNVDITYTTETLTHLTLSPPTAVIPAKSAFTATLTASQARDTPFSLPLTLTTPAAPHWRGRAAVLVSVQPLRSQLSVSPATLTAPTARPGETIVAHFTLTNDADVDAAVYLPDWAPHRERLAAGESAEDAWTGVAGLPADEHDDFSSVEDQPLPTVLPPTVVVTSDGPDVPAGTTAAAVRTALNSAALTVAPISCQEIIAGINLTKAQIAATEVEDRIRNAVRQLDRPVIMITDVSDVAAATLVTAAAACVVAGPARPPSGRRPQAPSVNVVFAQCAWPAEQRCTDAAAAVRATTVPVPAPFDLGVYLAAPVRAALGVPGDATLGVAAVRAFLPPDIAEHAVQVERNLAAVIARAKETNAAAEASAEALGGHEAVAAAEHADSEWLARTTSLVNAVKNVKSKVTITTESSNMTYVKDATPEITLPAWLVPPPPAPPVLPEPYHSSPVISMLPPNGANVLLAEPAFPAGRTLADAGLVVLPQHVYDAAVADAAVVEPKKTARQPARTTDDALASTVVPCLVHIPAKSSLTMVARFISPSVTTLRTAVRIVSAADLRGTVQLPVHISFTVALPSVDVSPKAFTTRPTTAPLKPQNRPSSRANSRPMSAAPVLPSAARYNPDTNELVFPSLPITDQQRTALLVVAPAQCTPATGIGAPPVPARMCTHTLHFPNNSLLPCHIHLNLIRPTLEPVKGRPTPVLPTVFTLSTTDLVVQAGSVGRVTITAAPCMTTTTETLEIVATDAASGAEVARSTVGLTAHGVVAAAVLSENEVQMNVAAPGTVVKRKITIKNTGGLPICYMARATEAVSAPAKTTPPPMVKPGTAGQGKKTPAAAPTAAVPATPALPTCAADVSSPTDELATMPFTLPAPGHVMPGQTAVLELKFTAPADGQTLHYAFTNVLMWSPQLPFTPPDARTIHRTPPGPPPAAPQGMDAGDAAVIIGSGYPLPVCAWQTHRLVLAGETFAPHARIFGVAPAAVTAVRAAKSAQPAWLTNLLSATPVVATSALDLGVVEIGTDVTGAAAVVNLGTRPITVWGSEIAPYSPAALAAHIATLDTGRGPKTDITSIIGDSTGISSRVAAVLATVAILSPGMHAPGIAVQMVNHVGGAVVKPVTATAVADDQKLQLTLPVRAETAAARINVQVTTPAAAAPVLGSAYAPTNLVHPSGTEQLAHYLETDTVSFGFTSVGSSLEGSVTITNDGTAPLAWHLTLPGEVVDMRAERDDPPKTLQTLTTGPVTVTPSAGLLQPGAHTTAKVIFTSSAPAHINQLLALRCSGQDSSYSGPALSRSDLTSLTEAGETLEPPRPPPAHLRGSARALGRAHRMPPMPAGHWLRIVGDAVEPAVEVSVPAAASGKEFSSVYLGGGTQTWRMDDEGNTKVVALDFGAVPLSSAQEEVILVKNLSPLETNVTLSMRSQKSPECFTLTPPTLSLPPHATGKVILRLAAPQLAATLDATLVATVTPPAAAHAAAPATATAKGPRKATLAAPAADTGIEHLVRCHAVAVSPYTFTIAADGSEPLTDDEIVLVNALFGQAAPATARGRGPRAMPQPVHASAAVHLGDFTEAPTVTFTLRNTSPFPHHMRAHMAEMRDGNLERVFNTTDCPWQLNRTDFALLPQADISLTLTYTPPAHVPPSGPALTPYKLPAGPWALALSVDGAGTAAGAAGIVSGQHVCKRLEISGDDLTDGVIRMEDVVVDEAAVKAAVAFAAQSDIQLVDTEPATGAAKSKTAKPAKTAGLPAHIDPETLIAALAPTSADLALLSASIPTSQRTLTITNYSPVGYRVCLTNAPTAVVVRPSALWVPARARATLHVAWRSASALESLATEAGLCITPPKPEAAAAAAEAYTANRNAETEATIRRMLSWRSTRTSIAPLVCALTDGLTFDVTPCTFAQGPPWSSEQQVAMRENGARVLRPRPEPVYTPNGPAEVAQFSLFGARAAASITVSALDMQGLVAFPVTQVGASSTMKINVVNSGAVASPVNVSFVWPDQSCPFSATPVIAQPSCTTAAAQAAMLAAAGGAVLPARPVPVPGVAWQRENLEGATPKIAPAKQSPPVTTSVSITFTPTTYADYECDATLSVGARHQPLLLQGESSLPSFIVKGDSGVSTVGSVNRVILEDGLVGTMQITNPKTQPLSFNLEPTSSSSSPADATAAMIVKAVPSSGTLPAGGTQLVSFVATYPHTLIAHLMASSMTSAPFTREFKLQAGDDTTTVTASGCISAGNSFALSNRQIRFRINERMPRTMQVFNGSDTEMLVTTSCPAPVSISPASLRLPVRGQTDVQVSVQATAPQTMMCYFIAGAVKESLAVIIE